jgi:deoxyribose-phosphate aldolase
VIGFPLGCNETEIKVLEAEQAVAQGAQELDVVANLGALKSKDYQRFEAEIRRVVEKARGRVVKVIIETGYLTEDEIFRACELIGSAQAQFVKNSTGFGPRGATLKDISLLRRARSSDSSKSGQIGRPEDH